MKKKEELMDGGAVFVYVVHATEVTQDPAECKTHILGVFDRLADAHRLMRAKVKESLEEFKDERVDFETSDQVILKSGDDYEYRIEIDDAPLNQGASGKSVEKPVVIKLSTSGKMTKKFKSGTEAREWIMDGITTCEGAERDHYVSLLKQLESGLDTLDYWAE